MRIFVLLINIILVVDEFIFERKILVFKVKFGWWFLEFISLVVINVKGC